MTRDSEPPSRNRSASRRPIRHYRVRPRDCQVAAGPHDSTVLYREPQYPGSRPVVPRHWQ
eukprot:712156-Hanusia_phi.AAC.1